MSCPRPLVVVLFRFGAGGRLGSGSFPTSGSVRIDDRLVGPRGWIAWTKKPSLLVRLGRKTCSCTCTHPVPLIDSPHAPTPVPLPRSFLSLPSGVSLSLSLSLSSLGFGFGDLCCPHARSIRGCARDGHRTRTHGVCSGQERGRSQSSQARGWKERTPRTADGMVRRSVRHVAGCGRRDPSETSALPRKIDLSGASNNAASDRVRIRRMGQDPRSTRRHDAKPKPSKKNQGRTNTCFPTTEEVDPSRTKTRCTPAT